MKKKIIKFGRELNKEKINQLKLKEYVMQYIQENKDENENKAQNDNNSII